MSNDLIRCFVSLQGSAGTRRVYLSDLTDLSAFQERQGHQLIEATVSDAVAWRSSLEDRGLAPVTIARKLSTARSFLLRPSWLLASWTYQTHKFMPCWPSEAFTSGLPAIRSP